LGSLGASAFGEIAGEAANSTVGTIALGAAAGGIGSELTGGNFWQGALIGGVVAGLNHTLHMEKTATDNDDEYLLNKDGSTKRIGSKGGDKTDYLYEPESTGSPKLRLLATAEVQNGFATASEGGGTRDFGVNIRLDNRLQSPALYDPSFDIAVTEIGGGAVFRGIRILSKGKFMFNFTYRNAGQTTFSLKWMNQAKNFMFRLEREHTIFKGGVSGYRTHINWHYLKGGPNAHIFLNPKYWKYSRF
jgi:hypothetical protein